MGWGKIGSVLLHRPYPTVPWELGIVIKKVCLTMPICLWRVKANSQETRERNLEGRSLQANGVCMLNSFFLLCSRKEASKASPILDTLAGDRSAVTTGFHRNYIWFHTGGRDAGFAIASFQGLREFVWSAGRKDGGMGSGNAPPFSKSGEGDDDWEGFLACPPRVSGSHNSKCSLSC